MHSEVLNSHSSASAAPVPDRQSHPWGRRSGTVLGCVSLAIYLTGILTFGVTLTVNLGGGIAALGPVMAAYVFGLGCLAVSIVVALLGAFLNGRCLYVLGLQAITVVLWLLSIKL